MFKSKLPLHMSELAHCVLANRTGVDSILETVNAEWYQAASKPQSKKDHPTSHQPHHHTHFFVGYCSDCVVAVGTIDITWKCCKTWSYHQCIDVTWRWWWNWPGNRLGRRRVHRGRMHRVGLLWWRRAWIWNRVRAWNRHRCTLVVHGTTRVLLSTCWTAIYNDFYITFTLHYYFRQRLTFLFYLSLSSDFQAGV